MNINEAIQMLGHMLKAMGEPIADDVLRISVHVAGDLQVVVKHLNDKYRSDMYNLPFYAGNQLFWTDKYCNIMISIGYQKNAGFILTVSTKEESFKFYKANAGEKLIRDTKDPVLQNIFKVLNQVYFPKEDTKHMQQLDLFANTGKPKMTENYREFKRQLAKLKGESYG